MKFLYFLEEIRNPVLDFLVGAITYLGDEIAFLAIALAVFWCVDKRRGYYLLGTGFAGTIINQTLKLCFRIPRPWVLDPNFKAVESAIPAATGYSFPSGHTQNVSCTVGGVARFAKKLWLRIVCIVLIVLVAFSRMYLGVHTPKDVLVSFAIGAILVFALYPLFELASKKKWLYYVIFGGMVVLSLGFMIFTQILPSFVELDPSHIASGVKNSATILGASVGILVVYALDDNLIKFDEKAPLVGQILKFAIGVALVVALKSGLKVVFGGSDEHFILRAVRYALIVVFAGGVYPLTFKWFAKLGRKREEK
ncbi:MAG: phosphatase PAP2 family protein [Ruminococcaceae bacterium]|nr:phosphatase PAP2 family protein [Oscillospiraceae bacterium]